MLAREVDMVKDDGVIEMPGPDEGTYALFIIGLCEADYKPATRNRNSRLSSVYVVSKNDTKLMI